jgi:ABC-type transport system involved in multi-copper enzyme maturation permease subunit
MIGRIFWVGANTVVEFIRDKSVTGFLFVGILFILCGYVIADLSFVEKEKMYLDTGLGAIFIVSVFITLLAGTNVIDRELREKQALCALAKPIPRAAWMAGKFAGYLFTLGVIVFLLTTFFFFYIRLQLGQWIPTIFAGGLFIYLEMVVLSSYVLLFSMITSQNMCLFFSLMVLIIGHLIDDLKIYWSTGSAFTRFLTHALFYVLPNLKTFLASPIVNGQIRLPYDYVISITCSTVLYLLISGILAGLLLNRKELS